MKALILAVFLLGFGAHAQLGGFSGNNNNLTGYSNDYYTFSDLGSGAIGSPGTGHTCALANTVQDINHSGEIVITSGIVSAAGQWCTINAGPAITGINGIVPWSHEQNVYVPVLPATTAGSYQVGLANGITVSPWTTGDGFYLSSANGVVNDWYCRYNSTQTDSTVAATVGWQKLKITSDGTYLYWFINNVPVCTGVVTTSVLNSGLMYIGSYTSVAGTTTSVSMYADYVNWFIQSVR